MFTKNDNSQNGQTTEKETPQNPYDDFFELEAAEEEKYSIVVYQRPAKGENAGKLIRLVSFTGRSPDVEKEIGEIFGRGTYLCKGHNPTTREKKDRTLNFDHEIWDERKKVRQQEDSKLSGKKDSGFGNDMEGMLLFTERIFGMAAKLQNPSMPQFDKILNPAYQRIGELQIQNFENGVKDREKLIKEFRGMKADPVEVARVETPDSENTMWNNPYVKEVVERIYNFGGEWMDSVGLKREKGREILESDPAFKEVMEDKNKIMAVYDLCCQNSNIGKELIDKIFFEVGMRVNEPKQEE